MKILGVAKFKDDYQISVLKGETFNIVDGGDGWVSLDAKIAIDNKHLDIYCNETGYKESNRYTLSQLIKSSEFKAIDLSVQMGKERNYLSSIASESRFNGRGDITQVKLDEIKLNMSLAEIGLKIKRDGLSRETISAEKPDFTFDVPKDFNIGLTPYTAKCFTDHKEDKIKRKCDLLQGRTKLAKKPKHNLNIFAILVTIAILVILLSIGYKYIF